MLTVNQARALENLENGFPMLVRGVHTSVLVERGLVEQVGNQWRITPYGRYELEYWRLENDV